MRKLFKYLPVAWLMLAGCGDEGEMRLPDTGYFPLQRGVYQIYEVHQVRYQLMTEIENITYQLKTEVVDSFANQQGGYTYTIHRSKRSAPSDPWQFQQVWSVRLTAAHAVVYEENIPFVKLAFPPIENRKWDGNALNNLAKDEYEITTKGKGYQMPGGETLGPFVRILQEDSGDFYNVNEAEETYVWGVGLVHRQVTDIEYCSDADDCDITQQVIDNGTIYVQTLIAYGQD